MTGHANGITSHSILTLHKTVIFNHNCEVANATERMWIAVNVLTGYSEALDMVMDPAVNTLRREIIRDANPQTGAFNRFDHFPFIEKEFQPYGPVGCGDPMAGDSIIMMRMLEADARLYL